MNMLENFLIFAAFGTSGYYLLSQFKASFSKKNSDCGSDCGCAKVIKKQS